MLASVVCVTGASAAYAAEIQIQAGPPSVALYGTVVGFGGYEWYVIGHNESGAVRESGTMTLLAKDYDFGDSIFNMNNSVYDGSYLHTAMKGVYTGKFTNPKEKALVKSRTLDEIWDGGAFNADGTLADQYVWPLSGGEYSRVPSINRNVLEYSARWWLRSPCGSDYACGVLEDGYNVFFIVPG